MCELCWRDDYGSPRIVNDRTRAAVPLIAAVDADGGPGMHIQLDDWNLRDEHFGTVYEALLDTDAERACFAALRGMSVDERASALAIHEGFFIPDAPVSA